MKAGLAACIQGTADIDPTSQEHSFGAYMNLTGWNLKKFEACRERGFVQLNWNEGRDEVTGLERHEAWVVGRKIGLHVTVHHVSIDPQGFTKKYRVTLAFRHKGETGDLVYSSPDHDELELDMALEYAQWQATVIFRLTEGEDAIPLSADSDHWLCGPSEIL